MPKRIQKEILDKAIAVYLTTRCSAIDAGKQVGISESAVLKELERPQHF